jgi:hypothetical protein
MKFTARTAAYGPVCLLVVASACSSGNATPSACVDGSCVDAATADASSRSEISTNLGAIQLWCRSHKNSYDKIPISLDDELGLRFLAATP